MRLNSLIPNLMVEDVTATAEWYADVLGFTIDSTVPGDDGAVNFAMTHRDDVHLMFQRRASLEADVPALAGVPIAASQTFFISVEDIDDLHDLIRDRVEVVVPLHDTWYGQREVYFRDPNGYILCFAQHLGQE